MSLRCLHDSNVQQSELDTLGHMNFRFYAERVHAANDLYFQMLGLDLSPPNAGRSMLTPVDIYHRFHREQFSGAPLRVQGGVTKLNEASAVMFYEVLNRDKGEPAATLIVEYALVDEVTRRPVGMPKALLEAAEKERVSPPPYGLPRSLDLAPPRPDLDYEALAERLSGTQSEDGLLRFLEIQLKEEDCDAHGWLRDDGDMIFNGGAQYHSEPSHLRGPKVLRTDEGHRFAWAWLELRTTRLASARCGDLLVSQGAHVAVSEKTRRSRRWTYNKTRRELVSVTDTMEIALDLDTRRTIKIPSNMSAALHAEFVPGLV